MLMNSNNSVKCEFKDDAIVLTIQGGTYYGDSNTNFRCR